MKLWLLRPQENLDKNDDPWNPWYDKTFGLVVRAETEAQAREMANFSDKGSFNHWINPKYSTCVELSQDGVPEIIIKDEYWA